MRLTFIEKMILTLTVKDSWDNYVFACIKLWATRNKRALHNCRDMTEKERIEVVYLLVDGVHCGIIEFPCTCETAQKKLWYLKAKVFRSLQQDDRFILLKSDQEMASEMQLILDMDPNCLINK